VQKCETVSRSMFLGDPGMEMMPECSCCMCYKHSKNKCLERFHFFHFFTKLVSQGMVLGDFLVTFGDLGVTFSDFLRVLDSHSDFRAFQGSLVAPKSKRTQPGGGESGVPAG